MRRGNLVRLLLVAVLGLFAVTLAPSAANATPTAAQVKPAVAASPAACCQYGPPTTVGTDVNMRGCASTSCGVVYTIHAAGTAVYPKCYVYGASVNGDTVWYNSGVPLPGGGEAYGYVAGYWLSTGHDPNSAFIKCG